MICLLVTLRQNIAIIVSWCSQNQLTMCKIYAMFEWVLMLYWQQKLNRKISKHPGSFFTQTVLHDNQALETTLWQNKYAVHAYVKLLLCLTFQPNDSWFGGWLREEQQEKKEIVASLKVNNPVYFLCRKFCLLVCYNILNYWKDWIRWLIGGLGGKTACSTKSQ